MPKAVEKNDYICDDRIDQQKLDEYTKDMSLEELKRFCDKLDSGEEDISKFYYDD